MNMKIVEKAGLLSAERPKRVIMRGAWWTQINYTRKGSVKETVVFWSRKHKRLSKHCGLWVDGVKL